jgi:hypothetical protein
MYNNVSYVDLYILVPLFMVVIFFVRKPVVVYLLPYPITCVKYLAIHVSSLTSILHVICILCRDYGECCHYRVLYVYYT